MLVSVNDDFHELPEGCSVAELMELVGNETKGLAVAQNNTVVPRDRWQLTRIQEGDSIMIIQATQGG